VAAPTTRARRIVERRRSSICTRHVRTTRQSALRQRPVTVNQARSRMGRVGIEPTTLGLRVRLRARPDGSVGIQDSAASAQPGTPQRRPHVRCRTQGLAASGSPRSRSETSWLDWHASAFSTEPAACPRTSSHRLASPHGVPRESLAAACSAGFISPMDEAAAALSWRIRKPGPPLAGDTVRDTPSVKHYPQARDRRTERH